MAKIKKTSWSEFEWITKIGLEAIGYEVDKDVLIAGSQIDLYAEKSQPLLKHRLVVECKDYEKAIGVEQIRNFSALVNAVNTKQKPIFGIFVAKCGFTNTARAFAKEVDLELLSLSDLLKCSFNPSEVSSYIIENYQKNDLSDKYIDLSCQVTETRGSTVYKPVEKFFDKYFKETKRPGIALLGDFGSGKTSLSLHYAYLLAVRWKAQSQPPLFLPIYINLRDFRDFLNLEENLYEFLRDVYKASLTTEGLNYWIKNKDTMLFLDGFDEMASKMDKYTINRNISSLIRFCEGTKVKIILSCRTHFLKNQVEEELLGTTLKLYLRNWGKDELVQYVNKANPKGSDGSLKTIRETYNLEELSKTPIFLNMIMQSIDKIGGVVNKSKLYEVYTDQWIHSQDYRSKLSSEEKMTFMEELAYEMFSNGQGKVKHEILPSRLKSHFAVRDYEFLVAVDQDIRTCSFLVRDVNGLYFFVHKSYMEYFVAKKLAREVKENNYSSMERMPISQEVATFFSDYFEKEKDIIIRSLLGNENENVRAGCALTIGFLGCNQDHYDALSLCVKTDNSTIVKMNAMESLAKWGTEPSIKLLVDIGHNDNDIAVKALRLLNEYMDNTNVLELFTDVLMSSVNNAKVKAALEGIEQVNDEFVSDVLFEFAEKDWWNESIDIAKLLVLAIPNKSHLRLVLTLDSIENKISSLISVEKKSELSSFIVTAKSDASLLFSSGIRKDAAENKRAGLVYSKNEGALRRKYKFLVTDASIKSVLEPLYGATLSSSNKAKISSEKKLTKASSRRAKSTSD